MATSWLWIVAILGLAAFLAWLMMRPPPISAPVLRGGEQIAARTENLARPETEKLRTLMQRAAEPALVLIDAQTPCFSKLGGSPTLPTDFVWPLTPVGHRQFFMQIDFAELPWDRSERPDWIPEDGRLWVFHRLEHPDRKDTIEVAYAAAETTLHETAAPSGTYTYPERPVAFHKFRAAPGGDWLGPKARSLRSETGDWEIQQEAGGYTFPSFDDIAHYIGGFPQEEHSPWPPVDAELSFGDKSSARTVRWSEGMELDPKIEEASSDWRMLLQIDSDHRMRWNWADRGRLYVMVRREDARRLDFSKTVTLTEFI